MIWITVVVAVLVVWVLILSGIVLGLSARQARTAKLLQAHHEALELAGQWMRCSDERVDRMGAVVNTNADLLRACLRGNLRP